MSDKLKPCPFCGKLPKFRGKNLIHITNMCLIGDISIIGRTKEDSIEMWNARYEPVSQPQPEQSPDRLRESLQKLVHLHNCEQEGILSGMPTSDEWAQAVNDAREALKY